MSTAMSAVVEVEGGGGASGCNRDLATKGHQDEAKRGCLSMLLTFTCAIQV